MRKLRRLVAASGRDFPLNPDQATAELILDQVSYRWPGGQLALDGCNLTIPGPGLWMLVGSNGSGKSTLFQLIAGLQQPQGGKISRRRHAALVFQNPDHQLLLPSCSSDLLLGMRNGGSAADQRRRAASLLRLLGLSELETRPIHTLSGGQKQRLAIAGALASDAGLLLLDEPTALLDPDSQHTVLTTVEGLCRSSPEPLTALWITHRLEELDHCTAAARMDAGRIGPWTSGKELRRRLQVGRSDR